MPGTNHPTTQTQEWLERSEGHCVLNTFPSASQYEGSLGVTSLDVALYHLQFDEIHFPSSLSPKLSLLPFIYVLDILAFSGPQG